ncbi:MAG: IS4-like element ISFac10 family transposase, partial [Thermoplasmata archaeon]
MNKEIKKILKDPIKMLSEATEIDVYSKKIDLLEHTSMFVNSIIKNNDLTDTALHHNVSKSQLSKLDMQRSYQIFVELFYMMIYPYIMGHNFKLYNKFLSIISIDSTFIKTKI